MLVKVLTSIKKKFPGFRAMRNIKMTLIECKNDLETLELMNVTESYFFKQN